MLTILSLAVLSKEWTNLLCMSIIILQDMNVLRCESSVVILQNIKFIAY